MNGMKERKKEMSTVCMRIIMQLRDSILIIHLRLPNRIHLLVIMDERITTKGLMKMS